MEAHYEILAAIQKIRAKLPIKTTMYHVKGHQDTGLTMVLSREAWMNIEIDKNAKEKVKKYTMPKILGEPWMLHQWPQISQEHQKTTQRPYAQCRDNRILDKKQQLCYSTMEIDWESMGRAMDKSTPA